MEFLVVLGVVAVFFIYKMARNNSRRIAQSWNAAASQLGMSFDPGSVTRTKAIEGLLQGHRVAVDTVVQSAGHKNHRRVTRYRVQFPEPLVEGLQLKQRGLFSAAAKLLGAQNIETGDADFDSRIVAKGRLPDRVASFLTRERRREVLNLFGKYRGIKIDAEGIEWTKPGVAKNTMEIVSNVDHLVSAASVLSGAETATPESRIARVVLPLATGATAAVLMDKFGVKPISVEAPAALRSEVPVTADAAPEAQAVEPAAGAEPEVAGEPAGAREPPVAAESAPAVRPVESSGPVATDIAAQLFARGITSTEAKRRFEEQYKGKRVRWTGNLRRASAYSIDITFKGGAGTKATFALPVASDGVFGGAIQAVVQLGPDAAAALRSRVGEEIAFEGRLLSCETLLRTFNIADARLV
jgi:hypothetical protein